MSIKVNYAKVAGASEAFKIVKSSITPDTIAKYNVTAEFSYDEDKAIIAKGKGFELKLNFDQTHCFGDLNLSFLFKPFKTKISESIQKQLTKIL